MADGATARASRANRRAIGVTCALHQGPRNFANLVVEKQGAEIVSGRHLAGACVMILDEGAARILSGIPGTWPG